MHDSEILIIGGGIAGASTAYQLAQHGHSVTLLERGEVASEASGVNAGNIGATGWGHVPTLNSHLTMGSLEMFKSLQLDVGYDIEYRQCGGLEAIQAAEQYEYMRDRVQKLRTDGYAVELLSCREARAMEPGLNPELLGFLYMPLRSQADPVKATQAFAAAATARGAEFLTGHKVTSVDHQGDGAYLVGTNQGEFRGQKLVIAAGGWCAQLGEMLGIHIPVVPVRGQMWATESLSPRVFHTISSVESELQWNQDRGNDADTPPDLTHKRGLRVTRHLYGRQNHQGEIIFGGDREVVGYASAPDSQGIEVNRGHAAEILPLLSSLPVKRTWAGIMPFSLDGDPIIGKIPQLDNLYIVSGLCSSGFGRGPMAGKLLADYIHLGDRPPVLAQADPARCVTALE